MRGEMRDTLVSQELSGPGASLRSIGMVQLKARIQPGALLSLPPGLASLRSASELREMGHSLRDTDP